MINTDGSTTIANAGADEFLRGALEAGGHLADDVAEVVELKHGDQNRLAEILRQEHPELD